MPLDWVASMKIAWDGVPFAPEPCGASGVHAASALITTMTVRVKFKRIRDVPLELNMPYRVDKHCHRRYGANGIKQLAVPCNCERRAYMNLANRSSPGA